jgi:hypothetical protein
MTPVGYYWGVYIELAPEILWIGDYMERLKAKLLALNYNATDLHAVVAEVIAPEVVTHLIAHDLGIGYDEALEVLRDETAWNYGRIIGNSAPAFIQKADLYTQLLDHVWLVAVIIAGCKNLGLCDWGIPFAKRFIRQY